MAGYISIPPVDTLGLAVGRRCRFGREGACGYDPCLLCQRGWGRLGSLESGVVLCKCSRKTFCASVLVKPSLVKPIGREPTPSADIKRRASARSALIVGAGRAFAMSSVDRACSRSRSRNRRSRRCSRSCSRRVRYVPMVLAQPARTWSRAPERRPPSASASAESRWDRDRHCRRLSFSRCRERSHGR